MLAWETTKMQNRSMHNTESQKHKDATSSPGRSTQNQVHMSISWGGNQNTVELRPTQYFFYVNKEIKDKLAQDTIR